MRVILITGISGSGKSIALNVLEDDGYYVIDNLPMNFLQEVIMSLQESGHDRVAVSLGTRGADALIDAKQVLAGLSRFGHDVRVIFLNARNDTLMQRYSETRRRHPIGLDLERQSDGNVVPTLEESIAAERERMSALEDLGVVIDTSDMHPNTLREWVRAIAQGQRIGLTLLFESFAYKIGIPLDADLVFDARCLPNPYYDRALRPLTGRDEAVAEYLQQIPSVGRFCDHIADFINTWLPSYIQENRSYLTVAIGCTGGQHRSVYCVENLAKRFSPAERVLIRHRALQERRTPGSAAA